MLTFPNSLSPAGFLAGHWQKTPLFVTGGLPRSLPSLSPNELAWLATQDDVESRLVFTRREGGDCRYELQHGPFGEAELRALPERDWTLLVQDVEKHLPDFRDWFSAVPFIPDWRIDDLMVSCAAPGGSVGPHRDHYDVFLCQADGTREWRLSADDRVLAEATKSPLRLLEPFVDTDPLVATRGDCLYLPPGVAHWGIATSLCVTFSIGMRAPTRQEILCGVERTTGRPAPPPPGEDSFYADPDLAASEAGPGRISRRTLDRVHALLGDASALRPDELARSLAAVVTDPKAWLAPCDDDNAAIAVGFGAGRTLPLHGMTRVAWCALDGDGCVGVNGHARPLAPAQFRSIARLCAERQASASLIGDSTLLNWLIDCAAFTLGAD